MELRHLRYFVAVAQERSFTRAAARLHMQQPPLSQQLQALEREIGVQLFNRLPRGVELTTAGAAFLDDAVAALAHVEASSERARGVAAGVLGSLSIGLASSAATQEIVPRVTACSSASAIPTYALLVEGNGEPFGSGARAARGRCARRSTRPVAATKLLQEPLLAAIASAHPLAADAKRREEGDPAARMAKEGFILRASSGALGSTRTWSLRAAPRASSRASPPRWGNMLTNILLVAAPAWVSPWCRPRCAESERFATTCRCVERESSRRRLHAVARARDRANPRSPDSRDRAGERAYRAVPPRAPIGRSRSRKRPNSSPKSGCVSLASRRRTSFTARAARAMRTSR